VTSSGKPTTLNSSQWKSQATQIISTTGQAQESVDDEGANGRGPKIPLNKIKLSANGMSSGADGAPVRSNSRTTIQKLKVNSQRRSSGVRVITDPQVILAQASAQVNKQMTMNDPPSQEPSP